MLPSTTMTSADRAAFAVSSRLLSCFVTEQILLAFYVSTPEIEHVAGLMIILSPTISAQPQGTLFPDDVLAVVLLGSAPVLLGGSATKYGRRIGLVDPLDMRPGILEYSTDKAYQKTTPLVGRIRRALQGPGYNLKSCTGKAIQNPVDLWHKFAVQSRIEGQMKQDIARELDSSRYYQYLSYQNPPACPSLRSEPIEWEQSLVAGHPTHPMHRTRLMPSGLRDYDWYRPLVRFAQVPKETVLLNGSFHEITRGLVDKALGATGTTLDHERFVFVPVHELQIPNVSKLFPTATILPETVHLRALAQSSIRTVIVPQLPGHALKLAVGVKISSSLRTISHWTAEFGPRFSRDIVPRLNVNKDILTIELEPHSVIFKHDDPDVQKHFTAVIREEYQPAPDETVIVCAALLETGHSNTASGISAAEHVFGLDSEQKRIQFLDRYIELSSKGLVPALVSNGVAFEAHAQNLLLRVNKVTGKLLGFVIRDLGGMRIHPETLRRSTGVNFQFLPDHCISTENVDDIYPKFYHTYVHNHVQRLIRLLDLHENGVGWEILRRHMSAVIPVSHPLRKLWLSPDSRLVQSKSLMRMRMKDSYRDNVYKPYPNMIQYRPETIDGRRQSSL